MYKYKLDKICFKSGNEIIPESITVIVGPNNCGKSRILKDILSLTTQQRPQTVLLNNVDFSMPNSLENLREAYDVSAYKDENGNFYLRTLASSMSESYNQHVGGADWEKSCTTFNTDTNRARFK